MSVYTPVSQQQLENFLFLYSLGDLVSFCGIQEGIENTNYQVTTSLGRYILTIYESLTAKELPRIFLLLNHLSQDDFSVPKPQACKMGHNSNYLIGKTAALFNCLPGSSINTPSLDQCYEIGEYLAKLHLFSSQVNYLQTNAKDLGGCQLLYSKIKALLTNDDINLLNSELCYQSSLSLPALPQGTIHADLFKDNVLFHQGHISGILDFYNACMGYFLFDIAVTCNDWCVEKGAFNQQKFISLLLGYQKIRMLSEDEKLYLPVFLRLAALRFYLSRLEHQLNPKAGDLILEKDPSVFSRLLEYHRANKMELIP